jgi:hypothetical protein
MMFLFLSAYYDEFVTMNKPWFLCQELGLDNKVFWIIIVASFRVKLEFLAVVSFQIIFHIKFCDFYPYIINGLIILFFSRF